MHIEQSKLKNQLDTVLVDSPGSTSATVQIWFRAGSALEKKDDQGIAHFLEHMFFKGTKKRPGSKIAAEVESFGGEINAFTSFDYTCYYINCPNHKLPQSVDILLDMVSNPQFLTKELIPERGVVLEEYRRSVDNPYQSHFFEIQKGCFLGGYKHPILGTPKTITKFTREQIRNFRKSYYNQANTLFVVAGDLGEHKNLKGLIEKFKIPKGEKSEFSNFKLKTKPTLAIQKKDVRQAVVTILIESTSLDQDCAIYEDLALNLLGHGETSPLYKQLVLEDTVATSQSVSNLFFNKGGINLLRAACPVENLSKVYNIFYKCIKQSLENPFSQQDLDKIKNQYIAARVYDRESLETFTFSLGHGFAQAKDIYFEDKFIKRVEDATIEQVNQGLKDIFAKTIHLALQIPKDTNKEKELPTLKEFQAKLTGLVKPIKPAKKAALKVASKSKLDNQAKLFKLKDGVQLLYRFNDLSPSFNLNAYIKSGISLENESNNGIHHLLACTVTKGNSNTEYAQLRNDLEYMSSSLSGFSGRNAHGLLSHGLSKNIDLHMQHFFDSLLAPTFGSKFVEQEKELTIRTIDNMAEDPVKVAFLNFHKLVFKNRPYSFHSGGSKESVSTITPQHLNQLQKNNINKKEIMLSFCGNYDLDTVYRKIEDYSSGLKGRSSSKYSPYPRSISKKPFYFQEFDREQTQIIIGFPGFNMGNKNDIHLKILNSFLSGQSSKLFTEVRDRKGLCYSVQPLHLSGIQAGYWGIYMASGYDKTLLSLEAIYGILDELRTKGLSLKEFRSTKEMIEGQSKIAVQTNEDYSTFYSIPALNQFGLDYHYKRLESVRNLKISEFNQFLSTFLDQQAIEVIVGRPFKN